MNAIYVLEGEERVGPFTAEEIRESVASGRFTLGHMGWTEGLEEWTQLSEIIGSGVAEEEEAVVVAEGPGYVLTTEALRVREEVFPLVAVNRATHETEHTKRGKPIIGSIIFGVTVAVLVGIPHKPETQNQWIFWGIVVGVLSLLFLRNLLMAFRPSPSFVAVHLNDGDDRVLPMDDREAKVAVKAINESLPERPHHHHHQAHAEEDPVTNG